MRPIPIFIGIIGAILVAAGLTDEVEVSEHTVNVGIGVIIGAAGLLFLAPDL